MNKPENDHENDHENNPDYYIENARIASTSISLDPVLTMFVNLEGAGWGGGFGRVIDSYDPATGTRKAHGWGLECLRRILETVGVTKWEDLPGKYVRVAHQGFGGGIQLIGHITEPKWFWFDQVPLPVECNDDGEKRGEK